MAGNMARNVARSVVGSGQSQGIIRERSGSCSDRGHSMIRVWSGCGRVMVRSIATHKPTYLALLSHKPSPTSSSCSTVPPVSTLALDSVGC